MHTACTALYNLSTNLAVSFYSETYNNNRQPENSYGPLLPTKGQISTLICNSFHGLFLHGERDAIDVGQMVFNLCQRISSKDKKAGEEFSILLIKKMSERIRYTPGKLLKNMKRPHGAYRIV